MRNSLPSSIPTVTPADLLLQRYDEVFGWCLQITGNDTYEAEDLIQDAYVVFKHSSTSGTELHNVEGYVYVVLRNLHRSKYERKRRHVPLSIVDYDCARLGLLVTDFSRRLLVVDQLRRICCFACERKETSRSGSILILRFFHGYFPSEIAAVLVASRESVEERLRTIRKEVREFLVRADRPVLVTSPKERRAFAESVESTRLKPPILGGETHAGVEELLEELRGRIFASCSSPCPSGSELARYYRPDALAALPTRLAAHIASCRACLEQVNSWLKMPPLQERTPSDTTRQRRDVSVITTLLRQRRIRQGRPMRRHEAQFARAAQEVYEHHPESLCVAVNGQPIVLQRITGACSETTLKLQHPGRIDFVEVFSEQDARLLMMPIAEPPPGGPFEQAAVARLSDGRELRAKFSWTHPWPTVEVCYQSDLIAVEPAASTATSKTAAELSSRHSAMHVWPLHAPWRWAGLVLSLASVVLYLVDQSRFNTAEARTLLADCHEWESVAREPGLDVIVQRFRFSENDQISTKDKIVEVWRGLGRKDRYVRLLDHSGKVLALSSRMPAPETPTDGLWQFEPSIESFQAFSHSDEHLRVERHDKVSEVVARRVTLLLKGDTRRPIGEILRINNRRVEFTETEFDSVPAGKSPLAPPRTAPQPFVSPKTARHAEAQLWRREEELQVAEIEARTRLHSLGIDLQEGATFRRDREGVSIDLVVDTQAQRDLIQRNLARTAFVTPHFRVIEDLGTSPTTSSSVANLAATNSPLRFRPLLEDSMMKRLGSTAAVNKQTQGVADASDQLLESAFALEQLADRYKGEEFTGLEPIARHQVARLLNVEVEEFAVALRRFEGLVAGLIEPVAIVSPRRETAVEESGANWQSLVRQLLEVTKQGDGLCSGLFFDTTTKPMTSAGEAAGDLLAVEQRLQRLLELLRIAAPEDWPSQEVSGIPQDAKR